MVLGTSEEVVQMDKFVTFVVQYGVGLRIELRLEEAMAQLAGNPVNVVVMIAEAQVDWHFEAVSDGLCIVEAGRVLKVKVVVGGGIVVEVVPDEKDLFNGGVERIDETWSKL